MVRMLTFVLIKLQVPSLNGQNDVISVFTLHRSPFLPNMCLKFWFKISPIAFRGSFQQVNSVFPKNVDNFIN